MEPWLDSLSEDWKSEHNSSSPASRISSSRSQIGSIAFTKSQSRIPHLSQSRGKTSVSSNYLQPRSARGLAKSKTSPVLAERTASNLNISAQAASNYDAGSERKRDPSTLPRRASSAFSDSQQSVQHHTLQYRSLRDGQKDTPEWKRRLAGGEDIAGEGIDLFGPSKLEGIFMKPAATREYSATVENDTERKPWTPFTLPSGTSPFEQQQSMRTSKGRLSNMEVLQEVNEDEHSMLDDADIESSLIRKGSIRGLVKNRVQCLESAKDRDPIQNSPQSKLPTANPERRSRNDPRWRTISGQEELMNEDLSPVTVSKQNTIRDRAVKDTLDINTDILQEKLASLNMEARRPSSSSSDKSIQYGHRKGEDVMLHEESLGDFTSHSLPEDLSMGTQEFFTKGGYVNKKRGGHSRDTSFQRKPLSPSGSSQFFPESKAIPTFIRSSPPPYNITDEFGLEDTKFSASAPITPRRPQDAGLLRSPDRPRSSGSPLKLFGDRDTYTNNKLLRVLSHFEDADIPRADVMGKHLLNDSGQDGNFRMSHFGEGDLNNFNFEQSTFREEIPITTVDGTQMSIFKVGELPNLMSSSRRSSKNGTRRTVTPPQHNIARIDFADSSMNTNAVETEGKRVPNSPLKDRTPKRRRTLIKEANDDLLQPPAFIHVESNSETAKLAGTKRKDSRADPAEPFADPDVLASRAMLRPIKAKRQSSIPIATLNSQPSSTQGSVNKDLTEALAAELASFTYGVAQAANDSRKPSVTTKDYMEEANKVMQFIRAKGKPKSNLSNVTESDDVSELNADAIIDMEVDGDSTRDSFSRPPSREGLRHLPRNRRHAEHNPEVANYLRKYQDQDNLDLLTNTSALGTFHLVDNKAAEEAALIPVFDDGQESEPSNIHIRNPNDHQRKRNHSLSDGLQSSQNVSHNHTSSESSTRQTFPTGSSGSSGHKGMITSGTVTIPDHVGFMKFDHMTKTWVKDRAGHINHHVRDRKEIQRTSEEDPFENIPDLSIDEREDFMTKADRPRRQEPETGRASEKSRHSAQNSLRSEVSDHELRILNGEVSQPPTASVNMKKQARVVTIAFSSPVVSAAYPREPSISELEDDTDLLPLDDSELALSSPASAKKHKTQGEATPILQSKTEFLSHKDAQQSLRFVPRPVSRIEEHDDEDKDQNHELSMVHVKNPGTVTPVSRKSHSAMNLPRTANRVASSLMCLTPLSEFSLHQVDKVQNPEQSYVEDRVHPTSLRQAHGSLALAVDDLVKAITDTESEEPFWENIRRLNLSDKGLTTLHGLREYCPSLEEVALGSNQVGQLGGLPSSLRTLSIQGNCLSSLTSWGHLQNLQYVNICGNQLESLDGFSSLVHLRDLDARNNKIEDIRGIFDLSGLLSVRLSGNLLTDVDFEGAEMTRLTGLDLSHNQIVSVQNLASLPSLEELSLDSNDLSTFGLPKMNQHLCLRGLSLSNNHLQTVDLVAFPALERLYLDRNRITHIQGLQQAQCLDNLSIREQSNSPEIVNYIMSTPNECRSISLSLNPVSGGCLHLPQRPHYNLRLLEMACCGIASLPQEFGDYLPNCRTLNLNFNAVKDLTPFRGMVKLRKLLLARNRVKRLRRTCLVLSRLKTLGAVDLRDNPLTVGFYAPMPTSGGLVVQAEGNAGVKVRDSYALEPGSVELDAKWLGLLDEVTSLRRGTIELLLAKNCEALTELDGMLFEREKFLKPGKVWNSLTNLGVLKKMVMHLEMPTMVEKEEREVTELPLDVETVVSDAGRDERSVMME